MKTFIYGTVFGVIVATVGFAGIARMLDKAVTLTKTQAVELSK
jgi:hypothetical protein